MLGQNPFTDGSILEKILGVSPFQPNTLELIQKQVDKNDPYIIQALDAWLEKKGIPKSSIAKAKINHKVLAYSRENYLKQWIINYKQKERLSKSTTEYRSRPQTDSVNSNTNKTEPASQINIPVLLDQIKSTINQILDQRFRETKIELSPEAIAEIKSLASTTAQFHIEERIKPNKIIIENTITAQTLDLGIQHEKFPILLRAAQIRDHKGYHPNIWLTGPAGSGKTSAAENVAKALNYPFEAEGALDADYKVLGFKSASGEYQETAFFRRFTQGGVFLMDEVDSWSPAALLAVNNPLANGFCQFPHGKFPRHKDFLVIACANTWGLGGTNDYVGRNRLDAATLDRFQPKINWPIDENLENALAVSMDNEIGSLWHKVILKARQNARNQGLKVMITPRATFAGIGLLAQGFSLEETVDMTFGAGLAPEQLVDIFNKYHWEKLPPKLLKPAVVLDLKDTYEDNVNSFIETIKNTAFALQNQNKPPAKTGLKADEFEF